MIKETRYRLRDSLAPYIIKELCTGSYPKDLKILDKFPVHVRPFPFLSVANSIEICSRVDYRCPRWLYWIKTMPIYKQIR